MDRSRRFQGRIAGLGSTSGVRVVVGRWDVSPFGAFTDAMVETAAGHRVLVAPTDEVADFVGATYTFDEVRIEPVVARGSTDRWELTSTSLTCGFDIGDRTGLGRLLRLVPARMATAPWFATLADPAARVLVPGVRTRGSAGGGRTEWYGGTDVHAVTALSGSFDGVDLGSLADVDPPCRFGFSSSPRRPCVTDVVTTISG